MTDYTYRTGVVGTGGATTGRIVVDASTLITLAKADPSGIQLDMLLRTGITRNYQEFRNYGDMIPIALINSPVHSAPSAPASVG